MSGGAGIFDVWRTGIADARGIGPDSLIISRDVQGRDRAYKEFRVYRGFSDYEVHLFDTALYRPDDRTKINHLYEVIPCGRTTPVWFFADHDCKESEARGMTEAEFAGAVCRIYYEYFKIGPDEINRTMFVSSTCRPGKLSIHVKINIRGTLAQAGDHAAIIAERCVDPRCRPDLSVYSSRFQQIRAAGSSKIGCFTAKRPLFGAGPAGHADHMVRINPSHKASELVRTPPAPSARAYAPNAVRVHEEGAVRTALKASALPGFFGPLFSPDACHIEDTRMEEEGKLSCYVDGSARRGGTLVCPFARRAHRSNRGRIYLRSTGEGFGEIEYRCLSPACREERMRIVLPYDLRGRM